MVLLHWLRQKNTHTHVIFFENQRVSLKKIKFLWFTNVKINFFPPKTLHEFFRTTYKWSCFACRCLWVSPRNQTLPTTIIEVTSQLSLWSLWNTICVRLLGDRYCTVYSWESETYPQMRCPSLAHRNHRDGNSNYSYH